MTSAMTSVIADFWCRSGSSHEPDVGVVVEMGEVTLANLAGQVRDIDGQERLQRLLDPLPVDTTWHNRLPGWMKEQAFAAKNGKRDGRDQRIAELEKEIERRDQVIGEYTIANRISKKLSDASR